MHRYWELFINKQTINVRHTFELVRITFSFTTSFFFLHRREQQKGFNSYALALDNPPAGQNLAPLYHTGPL